MLTLVFDTETTGLIDNRVVKNRLLPEVIEFYGCLVDLDTGVEVAEFETLLCPTLNEVSEKVSKITGLTMAEVLRQPKFPEVAQTIYDLIINADEVLAHNLSFDCEVIDVEMERLGREVKWPRKTCTVESSIHYKGFRLNLGDLYEYLFGERFTGAHRAKTDVKALVKVATEMRNRGDI
jgi:DNA polymerase-3 subunit epsilon